MTKKRRKPAPPPAEIDLHTHSSASDGSLAPAELIDRAVSLKLRALALTDHDTTAGLAEAEARARLLGLEFIRGCEISARDEQNGSELHFLGLWLPQESPALEKLLAIQRGRRVERARAIVLKLQGLGIDVSFAEVSALAYAEAPQEAIQEAIQDAVQDAPQEATQNAGLEAVQDAPQHGPLHILGNASPAAVSIGRPHIAELLRRKGVVPTTAHAFQLYLRHGCPAYVPKLLPSPADAVGLLRQAGATVALAHPMLGGKHNEPAFMLWLEGLVASLVPLGLDALEAFHSEQGPSASNAALALAARHNLLACGGSDYHGAHKPGIELGRGRKNLRLPMSMLDALKARRKALGQSV